MEAGGARTSRIIGMIVPLPNHRLRWLAAR
jgi:hypothetical protein